MPALTKSGGRIMDGAKWFTTSAREIRENGLNPAPKVRLGRRPPAVIRVPGGRDY